MKHSKAIQKITSKKDIAKRGLEDLNNAYLYDTLQEEMLSYFKAGEFAACIRVCNKIKKIKPHDPMVTLISIAAKSRLKE